MREEKTIPAVGKRSPAKEALKGAVMPRFPRGVKAVRTRWDRKRMRERQGNGMVSRRERPARIQGRMACRAGKDVLRRGRRKFSECQRTKGRAAEGLLLVKGAVVIVLDMRRIARAERKDKQGRI